MPKPEFTCAVVVRHLPEQSDPDSGRHAFAYTVTITNTGDVTGQLIGRHWIITDGNGQVEEVRGLGVVGHQPLLKPGEQFEYTSWTRLAHAHRHHAGHLLLHDRGCTAVRRAGRRIRPDARLRAALRRRRWQA